MERLGHDGDAAVSRFDTAWFSRRLSADVVSVDWGDTVVAGFVSGIKRVRVITRSGETMALVLKILHEGSSVDRQTVVSLGVAREADFYNFLVVLPPDQRAAFDAVLPRVYFAESDWKTGMKTIILEDLSDDSNGRGLNSGYFFGPGNPINWNKDLVALTESCPDVDAEMVALVSFLSLAKIHACFWLQDDLLEIPWLHWTGWIKGENQEGWELAMDRSREAFQRMKSALEAGTYPHDIPSELFRCAVKSFGKLTWKDFREEIKTTQWTFVHGDFHPGNIMWMKDSGQVKFLDWEMVGVSSGPQELGQYVISHMDINKYGKQTHERLVRAYYEELIRVSPNLKAKFPFELCWQEFVYGGFRKWLWMMPNMGEWFPAAIPFFVSQIEGFRRIHEIDEEKVGFPRL